MITSLYYLTICISKAHVLHRCAKFMRNQGESSSYDKQIQIYHHSGYFMGALGISYLLCCIWMYTYNQVIAYPQYIVFGVAAIAFYKIGFAIYGVLQARGKKQPVFSVIKIINFADACVSIVAIQCALLTMQKSTYASTSSSLLGMVVSLCFITFGIYMIFKRFTT
ncbi:hypothetical protein [Amedibacillus sp. YH-ame6]